MEYERIKMIETSRTPAQENDHTMEDVWPMLDETRELLEDFYRPHNERLSEVLHDGGYLWEPQPVLPPDVAVGEDEEEELVPPLAP